MISALGKSLTAGVCPLTLVQGCTSVGEEDRGSPDRERVEEGASVGRQCGSAAWQAVFGSEGSEGQPGFGLHGPAHLLLADTG